MFVDVLKTRGRFSIFETAFPRRVLMKVFAGSRGFSQTSNVRAIEETDMVSLSCTQLPWVRCGEKWMASGLGQM